MREAYRNEATPCVHCQDESFAGVTVVTGGIHQIRLKERYRLRGKLASIIKPMVLKCCITIFMDDTASTSICLPISRRFADVEAIYEQLELAWLDLGKSQLQHWHNTCLWKLWDSPPH